MGAAPASDVRKTVTVVFCDLVGSTSLGERTDPEVLRGLMSRYHAELRTILERHGGTVEKFVGDAAMAVFGLPQVHEDDALRAVRAAIEMRDAVARQGLQVRIGVNTGVVVAGTGETLVTGDAVNVAARLEQSADSGEVVIGAATERLVRSRLRAEPTEPLAVKGKSEPVQAFRVLTLLDDVPAYTRPIAAPFVGRKEELERLEQTLETAVQTRTSQLVTILGPPGIGKSRLVRELIGRARARILVGRCLPYGEGITYWPLREMVSQIGDVRAVLQDVPEGELAAARIASAIGGSDTPSTPEEIAWGARRLFEAMAATDPLVIVFDDIHWAEPVFLDLVEYVSAFAREVPLLLLCTARADLFDQRPTWTTPRPNVAVLTLEPLSAAESAVLVSDLAGMGSHNVGRIVETAEGNPLFVEQLVAMLSEDGDGGEVPPTLHALLTARIDGLAESERAVIERGAVEGRLFHRGAVSALLPGPDRPAVGGRLLMLLRKELIWPDHAVVPGDDAYRFSHALIRDAAYDEIPKRLRVILHAEYAGWLASRLGGDAPEEIVGYHLEQAYRYGAELGDPDSALGERAADRLAAAGQAARARGDVQAAANFLGRAADLLPGNPLRPAILLRLGEALHTAGENERARSVLEEAALLANAVEDDHVQWLARIELAAIRLETESWSPEAAQREANAALAASGSAENSEVLARAWDLLAAGHNWRADVPEWQRASEQAVRHARETGDLALEVQIVTHSAGPVVYGSVTVEEGLRYADDLAVRLGHVPQIQALSAHVRAHMRARLGEFAGAFDGVNAWRHHIRELGQESMYARTSGCAWDVCLWAQDWERGEEVLREGYEIEERMGMEILRSTSAALLGDAVRRQGRLDEAERLSVESEELGSSDDLFNEMLWRKLRANVLAARGQLEPAKALARQAVDSAVGVGFLDDLALAWLDLSRILGAAGDPEARAAATEALTLFERKGNLVGAGWARETLDEAAPDS
ncbi:MAG TPA: adenylate/guanylate cyclase domain-containing protein [Actinomycetota bacterium]|nr:adenylate/guanylate cyclase domain-containing protein [Actinomycetota bacterium]